MEKKYSLLQRLPIICFLLFQTFVLAQRDVYLVIGQSNTAGRGDIEAQDMVALTGVDLYNGSSWEAAENTLDVDVDGDLLGGMNRYSTILNENQDQGLTYAYTFGKMVNELTTNQIGLVVNARGGTSIDSWAKGHADNYYGEAITQITAALALGGSTLKGVLWHQGESDRNDTAYLTKLTDLIDDLRTDLGIADLPVIVGELSKQRLDNETFNANIKTICNPKSANYIAYTDYASTDGLQTSDRTHFNSNAQRVLGYRYAAKVLKMIYGYTYVQDQIIYVTEDAHVRGGAYSATVQTDQTLRIKNYPANADQERFSLLKFDIDDLTGTTGRTIVDATLMLNITAMPNSTTMDIDFYDVAPSSWTEGTVTYDTAPALTTQITSSTITWSEDNDDDDEDTDFDEMIHEGADLTAFIKGEYDLGTNDISLALHTTTTGNFSLTASTKEDASNYAIRPYIVTSYLLAPTTPSSGQTTKIAKLTFETDPTDTDPAITDMSYTTSITEFTEFTDTDKPEYFTRITDADLTVASYNRTNDLGDYYFAAQNVTDNKEDVVYLNINDINISGYENIEIRVYLAEEANTTKGWDNNPEDDELDHSARAFGSGQNDYVHFDYDIDNSGTFNPALWVEGVTYCRDPDDHDNHDAHIDTNFDGTGDGAALTNTFTQYSGTISGTGDLLDIQVVFRMNGDDEDIVIDNIEIWGTAISCNSITTWNGIVWSNGVPDITTSAIIAGNYSTTANGEFKACSLTVSPGIEFRVNNGTYLEVENSITNSGDIIVENYGNFIQNDDNGTFTNLALGTSIVAKKTNDLAAWWYYTYWSSPVNGLAIEDSPLANSTNRYWHNASNYLDEYIEIDNTDIFEVTPGSDDIDDDGDDWQWASDSQVMTPGVGYVATHPKSEYTGLDSYDYDFEGEFNTGEITVAIAFDSRNTGGHWNLIGNPYPGALDFDAFSTENSAIVEGAAYLWSHSTAASSSASGNKQENFSENDYIIINSGSGSVNNSPDTLLEYIPSGQSFFIASKANGNVTFNNSMRRTNGATNSQFFKSSNTKKSSAVTDNKIWINLSTDNGIFNQVLIAYVSGATNTYDGMKYDAFRLEGTGPSSIIYTLIEDKSDKKFAIQGKSINSINEDEIIPIGFASSIENTTSFDLSIQHVQGDFLTENTVYLKDNLLNKTHNLSESNYSFTSGTGEFNERFEIVFKTDATLSDTDMELHDNLLQVVHLSNQSIELKTLDNLTIKHISIYDLNGRSVYHANGESNIEICNLSSVSKAIYLAKVKLSNGETVFKKIPVY